MKTHICSLILASSLCVCRSGGGQCAGRCLSADVRGLQGEVWRPEEPQTAAHGAALHLHLTTPPPPSSPSSSSSATQHRCSPISLPPRPLFKDFRQLCSGRGEVHAGTQDWDILERGRVVWRTDVSAASPSLSSCRMFGSF